MTTPAIGEMVHYATREGTLAGTYERCCRAALVIEILEGDQPLFGVFDRHGMDVRAAVYSAEHADDTWHWPEGRSDDTKPGRGHRYWSPGVRDRGADPGPGSGLVVP